MSKKKLYVSSHIGGKNGKYNIYHDIETEKEILNGDSEPITLKVREGEMLADWTFLTGVLSRVEGKFLTKLEANIDIDRKLKAMKDEVRQLIAQECIDTREFLTNQKYYR